MKYNITKVHESYSSSLIEPRFIRLSRNLYIAAFSVMKLLPAKHIITRAIDRGEIDANTRVVETSSGNFALGLALVCNELGIPLHIVTDPAVDNLFRNRLENLHAEISMIQTPLEVGGYQKPRLETLKKILNENPNTFWTRQYDNPDNAGAYFALSDLLLEVMGNDFTLIGAVGSGGSTSGTINFLRKTNENIKLVGVDTYNSILFGLKDGNRLLRGLGNSVMPKNLDHSSFDQIHWVSASLGFAATRFLYERFCVFAGPTSGASFLVAHYLSKRFPEKNFVCIGPDSGERYLDTVFNTNWLKKHNVFLNHIDYDPINVVSTSEVNAASHWHCMNWNRKNNKKIKEVNRIEFQNSQTFIEK